MTANGHANGNGHARLIVQALGNYGDVLRDDGLSYGDYDELLRRDKVNLDIFWLRDASQDDAAGLDDPDAIAAEIVEDLRAALEEFEAIWADLAPSEDLAPA